MDTRPIRPSDMEAARLLLAANGWGQRVANADEFRQLVERSQRVFVALEGQRVVGFVRALCDDLSNGYIAMLVVARGSDS